MPKRRKKALTTRLRQGLHDHFLPHAGNEYVPHVLKHHVLFGYSLFLVLLKTAFLLSVLVLPASSLYSSAVTPENIVSLTNKTRQEFSLKELRVNPALARAARAKAENMIALQYFAHVSPDGVTPWQWIKNAGYSYRYAGENLAAHFSEAEDVQDAWMASSGHKANILSKKYSEIGVGVVRGDFNGAETTLVVQMFGEPKLIGTVASETDAAPEITQPEAVPSSVTSSQVVPTDDAFTVTIATVPDVVKASVITGNTVLPLEKSETPSEWKADLDAGVFAEPQIVSVLTVDRAGEESVTPLVTYAPASSAQQMYAFSEQGKTSLKIFGYEVHGLEDGVRKFYVAMVIALSAVLLLSVLVKFHVQRHTVTAHALFVIVLAGIMALV